MEALKLRVEEICRRALRKGEQEQISFRFLKTQLVREFDEDTVAAAKPKIKSWASVVLLGEESDQDPTSKPVAKRKSKVKDTFKSKEFLDSQDNPISGPSDEDAADDGGATAPPSKKRKRNDSKPASTETSKKGKAKAKGKTPEDPQEAEIERLKKFVRLCGARTTQKELGDKTPKQVIQYLNTKLAELGMTGRLSEQKAKDIKAKREFEQEMQDLVAGSEVALESGRASRSKAAAPIQRKSTAFRVVADSDSEEEGQKEQQALVSESEHQSTDEEFEKQQKNLDKQATKKVQSFLKGAKAEGLF